MQVLSIFHKSTITWSHKGTMSVCFSTLGGKNPSRLVYPRLAGWRAFEHPYNPMSATGVIFRCTMKCAVHARMVVCMCMYVFHRCICMLLQLVLLRALSCVVVGRLWCGVHAKDLCRKRAGLELTCTIGVVAT